MTDNPIVDEVHRVREELLKQFNGDIRALMREMQRRTEVAARAGVPVVAMPPRHSAQTSPSPRKVG